LAPARVKVINDHLSHRIRAALRMAMSPFLAVRVKGAGDLHMTQSTHEARQFSVRARHIDSHHARVLEEASFEAAAVAYIEDFHPSVENGNEIRVVVREIGTGSEHCFRIDLESGEATPCG
jgi:hypothetical protein